MNTLKNISGHFNLNIFQNNYTLFKITFFIAIPLNLHCIALKLFFSETLLQLGWPGVVNVEWGGGYSKKFYT